MTAQRVSHPAYGQGTIQSPVRNGYVTVLFGRDLTVMLPHTELSLTMGGGPFIAGGRVALDGRQGTVKSVDSAQVDVAWDDGRETYVSPALVDLTLLPPLAEGTLVKHKWTKAVGQLVHTPSRGDTLGTVKWNSGFVSNILLDVLAPTSPQKPQEDARTLETALAELRDEIDKWRRTEREAAEQVRVLTDKARFLLDAKKHRELVRSIQKW